MNENAFKRLALFCVASAMISLHAETLTWTGEGGDALVTTPANWGRATLPDLADGTVEAVFPSGVAKRTVAFPAGVTRFKRVTIQVGTDPEQTAMGTAYTFKAVDGADETAVLGIGEGGMLFGGYLKAIRVVWFNVRLAPRGEQTWTTEAALFDNNMDLRIQFARPFVDDPMEPFVRGVVTLTGAGRLTFASAGSTYTGDFILDKAESDVSPAWLGRSFASGDEPFGPSGTLTIIGKGSMTGYERLELKDLRTKKTIRLNFSHGKRILSLPANQSGVVFEGPVLAVGTDQSIMHAPNCVFAGGYGSVEEPATYANWDVQSDVTLTGVPSYLSKLQPQAMTGAIHLSVPSNVIKRIAAATEPKTTKVNVHFHTNAALALASTELVALSSETVWDFHGTEQWVSNLNCWTSGGTGATVFVSTNGPGKLNVAQTKGWGDYRDSSGASMTSVTGFNAFFWDVSLVGEMSLYVAGNKRVIVRRPSTAVGTLEIDRDASVCFTNGASWVSATNVTLKYSADLFVCHGNVFGPKTDLSLQSKWTKYLFLGEGPFVQEVRNLYIAGVKMPRGDYGPELQAPEGGSYIEGNGVIRVVGDRRETCILIR